MRTIGTSLLAIATLVVCLAPIQAEDKGPNGGILYEGGNHKFHIELKIDAANKTATAYILDDKAKTAVPIKAKSIMVKIKGMKEPIELTGVADKSESFTSYKGKADAFAGKIEFAGVTIEAKVIADKPTIVFELD